MLTKMLQFDDDVLTTIREMEWTSDGLSAKIVNTLDRALYVKVNKALEAMGGKWNRSAKAHLFDADPRQKVDGLLQSGELSVDRDGFFQTPLEVVRRMTELVKPTGNVLEPSAGLGAIADHLPILQDRVFCVEQNGERVRALSEKGYTVHWGDFLEYKGYMNSFDTCFMNPPFENGQDIAHVRHAYDLLYRGGKLVSVMSEGVFYRSDKKAVSFREWLADVNAYVEELPDGSFRESGTMVKTRLVVIEK